MLFGGAAGQVSALQLTRISRSGLRVSVPVKPSQTVFAQYRHISGVPASTGQRTVPLTRIQILNSLIDNLQRLKNDPSSRYTASRTNPERVDAMIQQYATELHQVMKSTPVAFGSLGGASEIGVVFSLSA